MHVTVEVKFRKKSIDEELASDIIYNWLLDSCTNGVVKLQESDGIVLFSITKSDAVELKVTEIPDWVTKHTNINFKNGVENDTE